MKNYPIFKVCASAAAAVVLAAILCSCGADKDTQTKNEAANGNSADQQVTENSVPAIDGEDENEEIVVNENYAESELIDFEATVDEIYADGSIMIYAPSLREIPDCKMILEFDENSVIDGFELAVNQQIGVEVYTVPKKSKPLTFVASKVTLVKEVSTQREEEAARQEKLKQKLDELGVK